MELTREQLLSIFEYSRVNLIRKVVTLGLYKTTTEVKRAYDMTAKKCHSVFASFGEVCYR